MSTGWFDRFIHGNSGNWYFDIDQTKGLCGGNFYRKDDARRHLIMKLVHYLDKLETESHSVSIEDEKDGRKK